LRAGARGASSLVELMQGEGMGWPLRMFQKEGYYFMT
jgi:hypothetical protein